MLGIALLWTTCGKVYNGITDDDTHDDILNLSIVYLVWCLGTGGLSCRRTRASGRFSCFLVVRFPWCFGLCDQDEVLSLGLS